MVDAKTTQVISGAREGYSQALQQAIAARQQYTPTEQQIRFSDPGIAGMQRRQTIAGQIAGYQKGVSSQQAAFETDVAKYATEQAKPEYIDVAYKEATSTIQNKIDAIQNKIAETQTYIKQSQEDLKNAEPYSKQSIVDRIEMQQDRLDKYNAELGVYKEALKAPKAEVVSQTFGGQLGYSAELASSKIQEGIESREAIRQQAREMGVLPYQVPEILATDVIKTGAEINKYMYQQAVFKDLGIKPITDVSGNVLRFEEVETRKSVPISQFATYYPEKAKVLQEKGFLTYETTPTELSPESEKAFKESIQNIYGMFSLQPTKGQEKVLAGLTSISSGISKSWSTISQPFIKVNTLIESKKEANVKRLQDISARKARGEKISWFESLEIGQGGAKLPYGLESTPETQTGKEFSIIDLPRYGGAKFVQAFPNVSSKIDTTISKYPLVEKGIRFVEGGTLETYQFALFQPAISLGTYDPNLKTNVKVKEGVNKKPGSQVIKEQVALDTKADLLRGKVKDTISKVIKIEKQPTRISEYGYLGKGTNDLTTAYNFISRKVNYATDVVGGKITQAGTKIQNIRDLIVSKTNQGISKLKTIEPVRFSSYPRYRSDYGYLGKGNSYVMTTLESIRRPIVSKTNYAIDILKGRTTQAVGKIGTTLSKVKSNIKDSIQFIPDEKLNSITYGLRKTSKNLIRVDKYPSRYSEYGYLGKGFSYPERIRSAIVRKTNYVTDIIKGRTTQAVGKLKQIELVRFDKYPSRGGDYGYIGKPYSIFERPYKYVKGKLTYASDVIMGKTTQFTERLSNIKPFSNYPSRGGDYGYIGKPYSIFERPYKYVKGKLVYVGDNIGGRISKIAQQKEIIKRATFPKTKFQEQLKQNVGEINPELKEIAKRASEKTIYPIKESKWQQAVKKNQEFYKPKPEENVGKGGTVQVLKRTETDFVAPIDRQKLAFDTQVNVPGGTSDILLPNIDNVGSMKLPTDLASIDFMESNFQGLNFAELKALPIVAGTSGLIKDKSKPKESNKPSSEKGKIPVIDLAKKPDINIEQLPSIKTNVAQFELQTPNIKQQQLQSLNIRQGTRQKTETKQIIETPTRLRIRFPSAQQTKRVTSLPFTSKQLYNVLVRRRGKWLTLGSPTSESRAKLRGARYAQTTLGRSFKLSEAGFGDISEISYRVPSEVFRPSKREAGVYVQRSKFALSSPTEKFEIKAAKRGKKLKWL